jgi:AraC-like DNA-binding protein
MPNQIYHHDLKHDNQIVPFAIRTMEEIDKRQGGIADLPHRHNYYTIMWPYNASGKHIIDFREYAITPDHIFFVSPHQVHQVITGPQPTGVVILFTPEFLEKNSIREDFISNLLLFSNCNETPPLPITEKMKSNLTVFVDAMLQSFRNSSEMRYEVIGAYLKLFLIECNTHCSLFREGDPQSVEVGRSLVKNFKDLVEKNSKQWHQVKDYANALNVTPGYLNDVIKSAINQSAKDYIQSRLILEAKRMVLFTNKSSKEIGFDLGFEDPSHFSKFYKSFTGSSLQEFKETHLV